MTRLIVTTDSSIAGAIQQAGLADLVIAIERRLVWGPLPADAELDAFFAPRTTQPRGLHWLDDTPSWRLEESGVKDRGLIELLAEYDTVEFWRGPEPNAQLILLWLLDHWGRQHDANPDFVVRSLSLGVRDVDPPRSELYPPAVAITPRQLKSAKRAWRAYRAPTPQSWRDLFKTNLSCLPQLAPHVRALLNELPVPPQALEPRKRGYSSSSREAACSLSMSFRAIRSATGWMCMVIGKLERCLTALRGARGRPCRDWIKVLFR